MSYLDNMIDNLPGPKEKVVIFAEGNANEVVYDNSGLPYNDLTPDMFPTAARDFVEANPQYEYRVIVGQGPRQLDKAFSSVNDFVDDNTRLIVMGHADSQGRFGGADPESWGRIIRDAGLRETFTEVAYGACGQGEMGICVDLSRAFGKNTTVYAQTGQKWGFASTPAYAFSREEEGGQKVSGVNPNLYQKYKDGTLTFDEAFRSVGSGVVIYKGGQTPVYKPGETSTINPYGNPGEDPIIYEEWDLSETRDYDRQLKYEMDKIGVPIEPEYPTLEEGAVQKSSLLNSKNAAEMDLAREFWESKNPGTVMPTRISPVTGEETYSFNNIDEYDFLNYLSDIRRPSRSQLESLREEYIRRDLDDFDYWGGGTVSGSEYAYLKKHLELSTTPQTAEQQAIYSRNLMAKASYQAAMDDYNIEYSEVKDLAVKNLFDRGVLAPKPSKMETLLTTDKDLPIPSYEVFLRNRNADDWLYNEDDLSERVEAFDNLWQTGNEAAQKSLEAAYAKLDSQQVIDPISNPDEFNALVKIEALKIYASSDEEDFMGFNTLINQYTGGNNAIKE